MRRLNLAEQTERDRAVGLNDQAAVQGRIGKRFDQHFIADIELIGPSRLIARDSIDAPQHVVNANAIHGHMRGRA